MRKGSVVSISVPVMDVKGITKQTLSTMEMDKKVKPKNALLKKVLADNKKQKVWDKSQNFGHSKDQDKIYEQNLRLLKQVSFNLVKSIA